MVRIVSLIPSATEMVCCLGLESSLVGVSHECDYPDSVRDLPRVTRSKIPGESDSLQIDTIVREYASRKESLYELNEELLLELAPDYIITQTLCNVCAVSDQAILRYRERSPKHFTTICLAPSSLEDLFGGMKQLGAALGRTAEAELKLRAFRDRLQSVREMTSRFHPKRVVFLEWLVPLYSAGHWTPELIRRAGGLECLGRESFPSARIDWEQIQDAKPDVLCVGCCGMGYETVEKEWVSSRSVYPWDDLECVREGRVTLFDGNAYFNRPGPRLIDSVELLARALHPGIESLQCQQ